MRPPLAQVLGSFSFLLLFILSVSTVRAFDNPSQYFDYSPATLNPNVLGLSVRAEAEASPAASHRDYRQFSYTLGFTANYTPADPLYFLKRAEESLKLAFTFDPLKKEEERLAIAGERLTEITSLAASADDRVSDLASSYQQTVEKLSDNLSAIKEAGTEVQALASLVDLESSKHTLVLEEIELQVPEEATESLDHALEASQKATDTVADVMDRPPIPPELLARLESLKAQGLLTEEEVSSLSSVDSRRQAREKLREYTKSRLLPESDFKKLDETARIFFPESYHANLEVRKFQELKDLENTRPDDATLSRVQEFAKNYQPGDPIPSDLRRWWAPLVRLEELNNTLRPDLIPSAIFQNRPEDQQKFQEFIERVKPREEDVEYVNKLISNNPNLLSDPAYARIVSLSAKFGTNSTPATLNTLKSCGRETHWVTIPFMPEGGYCVPNYTYSPVGNDNLAKDTPCPPNYHRSGPGDACYPDNSYGPGISSLPAKGTCPAGYRWNNTYCAPEYVSTGAYPSPTMSPSYCPAGQYFGPGGVCTDSSKSNEAYECSRTGKYWNGSSCQDSYPRPSYSPNPQMGGCKTPSECYDWCKANPGKCSGFNPDSTRPSDSPFSNSYSGNYVAPTSSLRCTPPSSGCGTGNYYDWGSCSCRASSSGTPSSSYTNYNYSSSNYTPTMSRDQQEATCRAGGGTCSWNNNVCSCQNYHAPTSNTSSSCSSGYYWNGSYCAPSSTTSTPNPTPNTAPSGMSRESQESGCRSCGGTCNWNGDFCSCQCGNTSTSTTPAPTESTPPPSTPAPVENTPPPSTPTPTESTPIPVSP